MLVLYVQYIDAEGSHKATNSLLLQVGWPSVLLHRLNKDIQHHLTQRT